MQRPGPVLFLLHEVKTAGVTDGQTSRLGEDHPQDDVWVSLAHERHADLVQPPEVAAELVELRSDVRSGQLGCGDTRGRTDRPELCLCAAQVIEVEEETIDAVGGGACLRALRQNRHMPRHRREQVAFRQFRSEDEHRGLSARFHSGQVRDLDDVDSVPQRVKGLGDIRRRGKYDERSHST